ncbi:hypothetical protein [Methylobacterium sp. J-068]|uniref:hypothetical protein n=1 Tax=Methylobacterium sp. J-068 TaxID=2836649 RepID=UPI001FBAD2D3|nr:hypothetical protein [Methylobacterium sp. J-068]MCJ2036667.1 hypothetical protein [Methylobacterium sp. J-068]
MAEASKVRDLDMRMAERRARGGAVRDLSSDSRNTDPAERPFLSPLGWLVAVALNIALVLLIGLSVVLVPPLFACREQSVRGFFAGDSFQACASQGIQARFRALDGRLRSVVLRSGQ